MPEFPSVAETGTTTAAANRLAITWMQAVLPLAVPTLHETCPGIDPERRTADSRRGLRPLADGRYDLHRGGVAIGDGYLVSETLGHANDLWENAGSVRPGEEFTMTCATGARARRSPGRIGTVPGTADGSMLATDRKGEPTARRMPTRPPERSALRSRRGLSSFHRAHA